MKNSKALLLFHHPVSNNAPTIMDHVSSFGKYSNNSFTNVNTIYGFPKTLGNYQFDIIVLHYSLFGSHPFSLFKPFFEYVRRQSSCIKIAFFQDEYQYCLSRFKLINELDISVNFFLPNLYFSKKVKYVTVIQALSSVISFPIFIFLIKSYSIMGCAIGICISNLVAVLIIYTWNHTFFKECVRVKYKWIRILIVLSLFLSTVCIYSILPEYSLYYEFIKSFFISLCLIIIIFCTLNKIEKNYIKSTTKSFFLKFSVYRPFNILK